MFLLKLCKSWVKWLTSKYLDLKNKFRKTKKDFARSEAVYNWMVKTIEKPNANFRKFFVWEWKIESHKNQWGV